MAYMRGEWYIYSTGENVEFHGPSLNGSMPMETMEELAAMVWHRLSPEQQADVKDRVITKHHGNFGADGVAQSMGVPTVMEMAEAEIERRQNVREGYGDRT